jgi:asparagine synthetase B (glutamine-hydrolysing)
LVVDGDRTAEVEIYLHVGRDSIRVSTDIGELLEDLTEAGIGIEIDPWGVSSLLHHGVARLPRTEFKDIYFLAMGDRALIEWVDGRPQVEWSVDYPWLNAKSSRDRIPSTRTLLDLVTAATERNVEEAGGKGVLMLSGGKDSSAVALALAEAGYRDIPAVTVSMGHDDPEPPVAAGVAAKLGLSHRVVELPQNIEEEERALTRFFASSPRACVDLSQIPYALAAATFDNDSGSVFDGGGNDSYMGVLPSRNDVIKHRFRLRSRRLSGLVDRAAPVDHLLNYLARSRVGNAFVGRTLRFAESRRLFPQAVDTAAQLWDESKRTRDLDLIDLHGVYRERNGDSAGSMMKQRLAAHSVGMSAALPFCDHDVADYFFNLPETSRFDRTTLTNKILLREMLLEHLSYDSATVGKHYFSFDGAGFISRHQRFVRDEVSSCRLWDPEGVRQVEEWIDLVDGRPFLYHAILTVFMISGWHNHSRYVRRGVSATVRTRFQT